MGGGLFAVDDGGFDVAESFRLDHLGEFGFGEAEPGVGVEFAGFVEAVLVEVEDDEGATGFQNAVGIFEGLGWVCGVVECLGEEGEVDRSIVDGDFFDVAEAVFEIWQGVLLGERCAELHHLRGVIDCDDLACSLCQKLGEGAFARAEIGDHVVVEDLDESFGEAFPGTTGDILAAELSGEFVEVSAGFILPFAEDVGEGGGILASFGEFGRSLGGNVEEIGLGLAGIDVVFAGAEVGDEAFFLQLGELGGDPGLAHSEDFL